MKLFGWLKRREIAVVVALVLANGFDLAMLILNCTLPPAQRTAFDGWAPIAIILVGVAALAPAAWVIVMPKRRMR